MLVKLPDNLKLLLAPVITVLVTDGLKALGDLFGIDLSGKAAAVAAAVVAAVFFFADALLARVPAEHAAAVDALLSLIYVLLASYGFHRELKRLSGAMV